MCRIFVPVAFALTALASAGALAQPLLAPAAATAEGAAERAAAPLTLASAVRLALENHPELAALGRAIEAAEGARTQAGAYQNPSLSVEVEDWRRDNRTTTVMLSQPLEWGGQRAARIAAAERAIDLARAQRDARQAELRSSVTAAFFAALTAQERVQLAQASLELASTGSQAAGKRVAAGKVAPVQETRARVAEASVRLEWVQAQGELQARLQELRGLSAAGAYIGVLAGDALALALLPAPEALEERLAQAPVLLQARMQVQRLRALADLESARRVPDLTVSAGIKRSQDAARNQAVVGVSVPLPFFDTNRGNLAEARGRQYQAEDEARAAELRLRTDVAGARQRLATALAEVAVVQAQILPGAQSVFDAARKGFELGKFDYMEALDAQRTLLQARAQLLRSVADAHRAAADLDRLLGAPVFLP